MFKELYLAAINLMACCGFINPLSAAAQQSLPTIKWERSYGGTQLDYAGNIHQTSDGGYIVASSSYSNDGDVLSHYGSTYQSDIWVLKLDATGAIQWQRTLGGSNGDSPTDIRQTFDGGYILCGESNSTDGDVTGNHGDQDYWVVKLGNAGTVQWEKCYGGSSYEYACGIRQTSDSGYIIAGNSYSTDGDVTGNHGQEDYWVVKIDTIGHIQWEKSYGGSGSEQAYAMAATRHDGCIVAGIANQNSGEVSGVHGGNDYWIVKTDSAGDLLWAKTYGGTSHEYPYGIDTTNDGGYIVAGASQSTDGDVTGNHGKYDYWAVKLSDTGRVEWERSLGGSGIDYANSCHETTDGGYIVAGFSNSNDSEVTGNHGEYDYWIVKLDPNGNIQWEKSLGGSNTDMAADCRQISNENYIVTGGSMSKDGDVTGHHGDTSQYDGWIAELQTAPRIASDSNMTFAPMVCEEKELDTIVVHNIGTKKLEITSAAFGNPNYVLIIPSRFPVTVETDDSVPFIALFYPDVTGSFPTTLNIYSSDAANSPWTVNVSGTKNKIGFDFSGVAGDTLDFGTLLVNHSKDTACFLHNSSTIPTTLHLTHTGIHFLVQADSMLGAAEPDTIAVFFWGAPAPITYSDSLMIADTCGGSRTLYILARVDTNIPQAAYIQATDSLDFGILHVGTQKSLPFTITSGATSTNNIIVTGITLQGGDAAQYALSGTPTTPDTLAPGMRQAMTLTFTPEKTGELNATVEVLSNATPGTLDVPVSGIGSRSVLTADSLDFDTVALGECKTKNLVLRNEGNEPATLTSFEIYGVYASAYTLMTNTSNVTLVPGDMLALALRFCPAAAGTEDVDAEIVTSNGDTLFAIIYGSGPVVNAVNQQTAVPGSTTLSQNYPNPFSNETVIRVTLSPADAAGATLRVYNMLGEEVADLTNQLQTNGDVALSARTLQQGVYYYVLRTGSGRWTREMFVVK